MFYRSRKKAFLGRKGIGQFLTKKCQSFFSLSKKKICDIIMTEWKSFEKRVCLLLFLMNNVKNDLNQNILFKKVFLEREFSQKYDCVDRKAYT